jgi:hypothetical protein
VDALDRGSPDKLDKNRVGHGAVGLLKSEANAPMQGAGLAKS